MSNTSKSRRVCLIGWPIRHSPSPAMHNAAFEALGLDWVYEALPVEPGDEARIRDAITGLKRLGYVGANVTIPHKQGVIRYLDSVSYTAGSIGAVNTIVISGNGDMTGDNTDAAGFIADLDDRGVDPSGANALIIGAGGSARAVAWAVAGAGAGSISIAARRLSKAIHLAEEMKKLFKKTPFKALRFSDVERVDTTEYALVVSCIPPDSYAAEETAALLDDLKLDRKQVVYDLAYRPVVTPILERASRSGATTLGGLGMLVRQGALSFEIWTGTEAPLDVMRAAAEDFVRRTV